MTDTIARFGMNLLLCAMALPAVAAQSEQTSSDTAPPPSAAATDAPPAVFHRSLNMIRQVGQSPEDGEPAHGEQQGQRPNRFFALGTEANEYAQRMKERLADPEQRAALRAEQRALLVAQNAGVGRALGLDVATEQKLIELLTDQQMKQLEQTSMMSAPDAFDLHKHAEEATQRMDALSALLGDSKLERYQEFARAQPARYWVSQFVSRLAPTDKLQPDQEDRLIALKQEQFDAASEARGPRQALRRPLGRPTADAMRSLQLQSVRANENSWRRRQVEVPALEQKAAAFLTPTQLAELSKLHAQEQDSLRRYIESVRAQAGLDRSIPETPEVEEEASVLIDAQLQIELSMTVNRETTTLLRTVRSGESFTFEAAPRLIVEATPAMYDQEWVELQLNYFEDGVTGRRRLPGTMTTTAQPGEFEGPLASRGSGSVVAGGRRGYAVETNFRAKIL